MADATNAPDGWVSIGVVRDYQAQMLVDLLRGAGIRVVTRHALRMTIDAQQGSMPTEILVPIEDEAGASQIASGWGDRGQPSPAP